MTDNYVTSNPVTGNKGYGAVRVKLSLKLARQSPRMLAYGEESPGSTEQDAG